jgi:hypothetical protein
MEADYLLFTFVYMDPGRNPACLMGNFDSFSRGKVAEA